MNLRSLACVHVGQLRLLEVGRNPCIDSRDDHHERLRLTHAVAHFGATLRHNSANRCNDVAEVEIERGALNLRRRGFDVRLGGCQIRLPNGKLPRSYSRHLLALGGLGLDVRPTLLDQLCRAAAQRLASSRGRRSHRRRSGGDRPSSSWREIVPAWNSCS